MTMVYRHVFLLPILMRGHIPDYELELGQHAGLLDLVHARHAVLI